MNPAMFHLKETWLTEVHGNLQENQLKWVISQLLMIQEPIGFEYVMKEYPTHL